MRESRFGPALPETPPFTIGDGLILLGTASALYAGLRLAFNVPAIIRGPEISLSPLALPWYNLLSVGRMAAATFFLCCSFCFTVTPPRATAPREWCSCPCSTCCKVCPTCHSCR